MTDAVIPDPPESGEPVLTPEQIAGRPLVDLTLDELKDLATEVGLANRSRLKRDELMVALGGDPDAMTDAERVKAAARLAKAEAKSAPDQDPLTLMPWERHEDIDPPPDVQ